MTPPLSPVHALKCKAYRWAVAVGFLVGQAEQAVYGVDPSSEGRGGKIRLPVFDIASPIRCGAAPGLEPFGIAPGREVGESRR